jgi:predicted AAA+ superfamily ATPase
MYIKRQIEAQLIAYTKIFPAVALTGPRQAGKSTLLQNSLPNYRFVSFDDYRVRSFIQQDPVGFIAEYSDKVIFDEAQKAPELFNLVKQYIDADRKNYGKFILTGSSHFSFIKNIRESLAGRIGLLSLLPLQFLEIPLDAQNKAIYKGCYPELVLRNYRGAEAWYSSYLDTYLTRDIGDLIQLNDVVDFRRFLSLLAANTSQVLNMSNYAKHIGVTVQTIKRWLTVLEATYIVFRLQPYHDNFGKRITKSPKVYFYDTGLVSYLTKNYNHDHFINGPMAGSIFENYIVAETMKHEFNSGRNGELYYFRDSNGQEIDLIIEGKHARVLVEIKFTKTSKAQYFKNMKDLAGANDHKLLVYNGDDFSYGKNSKAINYKKYFLEQ